MCPNIAAHLKKIRNNLLSKAILYSAKCKRCVVWWGKILIDICTCLITMFAIWMTGSLSGSGKTPFLPAHSMSKLRILKGATSAQSSSGRWEIKSSHETSTSIWKPTVTLVFYVVTHTKLLLDRGAWEKHCLPAARLAKIVVQGKGSFTFLTFWNASSFGTSLYSFEISL